MTVSSRTLTQEEWDNVVNHGHSMEFDWYGLDYEGNLAAFSSVNAGPIPSVNRRSLEDYIALKNFIYQLPISSTAVVVTKRQGNFSDWITYAKQGLFAYDVQDFYDGCKRGIYDLITVPSTPIKAAQLPSWTLYLLPCVEDVFGSDLAFEKIPK